MRATTLGALVSLLVVASTAGAQRSGRAPVSAVRGVVFDSVRGAPLRDALVTIAGRSTTTDARGRFRVDSVPDGLRTISVQHASLDTLGLFGISRRAELHGDTGEIQVAVPSFATLWHNGCGPSKPPADSGIVYGIVRDARSHDAVRGAQLELVWTELGLRDVGSGRNVHKEVFERRWKSDTRSAADGTYAFCEVPPSAIMRLRASTKDAETGAVELELAGFRIRRQDLTLGQKGVRTGLIVGYLIDDAGNPFVDALMTLDDSHEARSEVDGRFVFSNEATGSHQLVAHYIGAAPVHRTIDIVAGDTTAVAMTMSKVVTLSTMQVASPERANMLREEYESRQIMYHRFMFDSTYIGRQGSLANVFQSIPNVRVKRGGLSDFTVLVPDRHEGYCTPDLRVDGVVINDFGQLAAIPPSRVVAIEVYPFAGEVPAEFQRGGIHYACGLVVVWTRWAFRIP
jgi:hypothetical protein